VAYELTEARNIRSNRGTIKTTKQIVGLLSPCRIISFLSLVIEYFYY
jgi:hypothetical protein